MANPIWKDYYLDLGAVDSILYRISLDDTGEVIYVGKAFKRPGKDSITIKINDICADYLQNVLPYLSQAEFTDLNLPLVFAVESSSDGLSWLLEEKVDFLNDWSYDNDYDPAVMGMSFPINNHMDVRMPIVWTGYEVSEIDATIYLRDGSTYQVIIPLEISEDFNDDFNNDFARSVRVAGSGTAVFYPSAWGDVVKVEINGYTFDMVQPCARYALYYANAYGGWDAFLIEGNTLEADALVRLNREMVYDNRDIQNRGIQNYVNEITKGFTFHTGWLTGDQGERMHHLLNSTNVYMYDIAREQMIPVTIPTSTCEYKTYKNQGNRLVNYTIQVEVAQNRIRR